MLSIILHFITTYNINTESNEVVEYELHDVIFQHNIQHQHDNVQIIHNEL